MQWCNQFRWIWQSTILHCNSIIITFGFIQSEWGTGMSDHFFCIRWVLHSWITCCHLWLPRKTKQKQTLLNIPDGPSLKRVYLINIFYVWTNRKWARCKLVFATLHWVKFVLPTTLQQTLSFGSQGSLRLWERTICTWWPNGCCGYV